MPDVGEVRYKTQVDNSDVDRQINETEEKIKKASQGAESAVKAANEAVEKSSKDAAAAVASDADKAADAVKSAAKEAGDGFSSGFAAGLDPAKQTNSEVADAVVGKWQSAAKTVGVAFAGMAAGAVAFGVKSIDLASDLAEVQNVVDVTFGDGAEEINQWAKSAGAAFGLSELSAKQYSSTIGAMLKSMGLSSEATQEMSLALTGLAGDMASFYNLDASDAFEKLRSGISGETEPLKQLGINMSVANLEAFALSKGITTAYDSMSQAEQATLRYQYIMEATADAQGDFSRTSDSLANQQRTLQMEVETLSADLGAALLPVALDVVGALRDLVQWASENSTTVAILAVAVTGITAAIIAYSASLTLAASGMTLATAAGAAFGAVVAFLTSPITLVIAAITALVAAGILLYKNWDEVSAWAASAWDKIKETISGAIEAVKGFFQSIIDFVKNNWQSLLLLLVNPFAGAFKLLYEHCEGFRNTVNNMVSKVKEAFSNLATGISTTVGNIRDSIVNGFQRAVDYITSLPGKALEWGKDFIQGFADGVRARISSITDAVKGVADTITSWLHFSKPDVGPLREYEKWMPDMVHGLAAGVRQNEGELESAVSSMADSSSSQLKKMAYKAAQWAGFDSGLPASGSISPGTFPSIPLFDFGAHQMARDERQTIEVNIAPYSSSTGATIEVPISIDGREVARATAWYMGEELAWEAR